MLVWCVPDYELFLMLQDVEHPRDTLFSLYNALLQRIRVFHIQIYAGYSVDLSSMAEFDLNKPYTVSYYAFLYPFNRRSSVTLCP